MIVALILLGAILGVGSLLWAHDRMTRKQSADRASDDAHDGESASDAESSDNEGCCGMHITCERDSLSVTDTNIIYYDDEELDRYAGISADDYDESQIEEFRDILLTLIPTDIAPWARSLQLRGINLPTTVRDELLMIVADARTKQL